MGKKKAAIYVRVSTMNQVDRDSLKTQEERLTAFCAANEYDVYRVYKDAGESAKDTNRPALEELLADMKAGLIDVVVVTKFDRISRSVKDFMSLLELFSKTNVQFSSLGESFDTDRAFGRYMRNQLVLIAQLERETTAERVATDMRHRAIKGKWNGGVVPHGYRTQGLLQKQFKDEGMDTASALGKATEMCPAAKKLYVDPDEAEMIRWIYDTFIETNSIRKTTHLINAKGTRTRRGALWATSSIHRILTNPTYTGKVWYGKRKTDPTTGKLVAQDEDTWTVVDGEHDGIIELEQFEKAQAMLRSNYFKPKRVGRTYLLSGLMRCGLCGGAMTGYTFTKKGTDKQYSYYKCNHYLQKGTTACSGQSIPALQIEDFVVETLMNLSKDTQFLSDKEKMLALLKEKVGSGGGKAELAKLEGHERDLKVRLDRLMDSLETGMIEEADFTPRYRKIKEGITAIQDQRTRIQGMDDFGKAAYDNLAASFAEVSAFGKNWGFLDDDGKSMRIRSVVKEIRATKEKADIDIFLDVEDVSRMVRDSSRQ